MALQFSRAARIGRRARDTRRVHLTDLGSCSRTAAVSRNLAPKLTKGIELCCRALTWPTDGRRNCYLTSAHRRARSQWSKGIIGNRGRKKVSEEAVRTAFSVGQLLTK